MMSGIVSGPALWVASLVLDGLALAAVAAAWRQLGRSAALLTLLKGEAEQARTMLRVTGLEDAKALRPEAGWTTSQENTPEQAEGQASEEAEPLPQPQPKAGPAPQPEPRPEPQPEPRVISWTEPHLEFAPVRLATVEPEPFSELDRAVSAVNDPLAVRLEMLARWEAAAGVRLASLSSIPVRFGHYHRELQDAQSMLQVTAAGQDIQAAWPELLATLAGSMDRDLDPQRANEPMQWGMTELLRELGVVWIDPAQGDLFDAARHRTLGVFRRGTAAEAGRVGDVLCRGLEDRRGRVILRAEVREFG